jgi:hypothetical protein
VPEHEAQAPVENLFEDIDTILARERRG